MSLFNNLMYKLSPIKPSCDSVVSPAFLPEISIDVIEGMFSVTSEIFSNRFCRRKIWTRVSEDYKGMFSMPREILNHIFWYLSPQDMPRASLCNTAWNGHVLQAAYNRELMAIEEVISFFTQALEGKIPEDQMNTIKEIPELIDGYAQAEEGFSNLIAIKKAVLKLRDQYLLPALSMLTEEELNDLETQFISPRFFSVFGRNIFALTKIDIRITEARNEDDYFNIGISLVDLQEFDRALEMVSRITRNKEKCNELLMYIGIGFITVQESNKALEEVVPKIEDVQIRNVLLEAIGRSFVEKQEPDRALEEVVPKIEDVQIRDLLLQSIGMNFVEKQEPDKALEEVVPKIEDVQIRDGLLYAIGKSFVEKQEPDKALEEVVPKIENVRIRDDLLKAIGMSFVEKQEPDKALEEVVPKCRSWTRNVLLEAIGRSFVEKQEPDKALEEVVPKMDDAENRDALLYAIGKSLVEKQEPDRALEEVVPKIEDVQIRDGLLYAIGKSFVEKQEPDKALEEVAPKIEGARIRDLLLQAIGMNFVEKQEPDRALEKVVPKIEGARIRDDLLKAIGMSFVEKQEPDRALQEVVPKCQTWTQDVLLKAVGMHLVSCGKWDETVAIVLSIQGEEIRYALLQTFMDAFVKETDDAEIVKWAREVSCDSIRWTNIIKAAIIEALVRLQKLSIALEIVPMIQSQRMSDISYLRISYGFITSGELEPVFSILPKISQENFSMYPDALSRLLKIFKREDENAKKKVLEWLKKGSNDLIRVKAVEKLLDLELLTSAKEIIPTIQNEASRNECLMMLAESQELEGERESLF